MASLACAVIEGSAHTYRIDRVRRASKVVGPSFEIPEDFDVRDWQKLPFQIGPVTCDGVFAVPVQAAQEFSKVTLGKGTFLEPDDTLGANEVATTSHSPASLLWRIEISSLDDAASWAIAEDITPIAPSELVSAWRSKLKGVVAYG